MSNTTREIFYGTLVAKHQCMHSDFRPDLIAVGVRYRPLAIQTWRICWSWPRLTLHIRHSSFTYCKCTFILLLLLLCSWDWTESLGDRHCKRTRDLWHCRFYEMRTISHLTSSAQKVRICDPYTIFSEHDYVHSTKIVFRHEVPYCRSTTLLPIMTLCYLLDN